MSRVRRRVSVRRLSALSNLSLVAATLVGALICYPGLRRSISAIEAADDRALQLRTAVDARLLAMLNQEVGLRGFLATGDDRFLEPFDAGFRDGIRLRTELSEGLADQERDEMSAAFEDEVAAAHRWRREVALPQIARRHAGAIADLPAQLRTGKQSFDAYRAAHARLRDALDRTSALHARSRREQLTMRCLGITALLMTFVLLAGAVARHIVQRTVRPIVALSDAAQRGEVTTDAVRASGIHEVIVLAETMEQLFRAVQERAMRDGLTRAYNRGFLAEWLPRQLRLVRRNRGQLSALMVDVDHFKKINDSFGHAAGDQVLVAMARCMEQQLRTTDVVVRYGGEEFTVFLPDTPVAGGFVTAERLRAAIAAMTEREGLPPGLRITASVGVAAVGIGDDGAQLLQRADAALYQAKRAGRNRVVAAPPPPPMVGADGDAADGEERTAAA